MFVITLGHVAATGAACYQSKPFRLCRRIIHLLLEGWHGMAVTSVVSRGTLSSPKQFTETHGE